MVRERGRGGEEVEGLELVKRELRWYGCCAEEGPAAASCNEGERPLGSTGPLTFGTWEVGVGGMEEMVMEGRGGKGDKTWVELSAQNSVRVIE